MTTEEFDALVEYYTDLLIIQYHSKPNARATISLLVRVLLAGVIIQQVRDAFNLDTAVGKQLDTLGKYIGVDRFFEGQNFTGFFGFCDYGQTEALPGDIIGFSTYADYDTKEGRTATYHDIVSGSLSLNDDDYRFILRLKIIQNNSNHSHASIDTSLFNAFGTTVYADTANLMDMTYFVGPQFRALVLIALQKGVLPKPLGVGLRYIIQQNTRFFAFSTYSAPLQPIVTGFSTYDDYDTKDGQTLTYNDLLG